MFIIKNIFLMITVGTVAGFVNGLFGTGGALPLLALFAYLSLEPGKALASANLIVIALSLVSFIIYIKNGTLDSKFIPIFLKGGFVPALLGGAVGSLLLSKLSSSFLKKLFCLITVIGGVGVIFK